MTTTRTATPAEARAAISIAAGIAEIFTDGPARFDRDQFAIMLKFKLDGWDIPPEVIDFDVYQYYITAADARELATRPIPTSLSKHCANCSDLLTSEAGEWNGFCHACAQLAAPERIAAELRDEIKAQRAERRDHARAAWNRHDLTRYGRNSQPITDRRRAIENTLAENDLP